MTPSNYQNIATNTTTTVKTGRGILKGISVNTTAAGTIKITDSTDGASGNIAILKASVAEGFYPFNCKFITGLTIVTAGASDITVLFE